MAAPAPTAAPAAAPPAPPRPAPPTPPAPAAAPPAPPTAPPPAASTASAPPPVLDTNPVELQLFRYTKPDDTMFIVARVLNVNDLGMEDQTVTFSSGKDGRNDVDTDENGVCEYPYTITKTSQDQRLTALVSGISSPAVMHIPAKRVPKTQEQIDRDFRNNKIAKWAIRITAGLWLVWVILLMCFGSGKPLADLRRMELTEQQQLLNSMPGVKGGPLEAKTDKAISLKEQWQKPSWLILIALTIITIGYGILSLREELMEALRNGWSRILDKRGHLAFAKDSALQRWLELVGLLKVARSRREIPIPAVTLSTTAPETPTATTPQPVVYKNTFWELFRSDLLSDFTMEVLPGLLRKIFR